MWFWRDGLTKEQRMRRDALGIALAAHEHNDVSATLLILEAQRITAYIENGDEFLEKDKNRDGTRG